MAVNKPAVMATKNNVVNDVLRRICGGKQQILSGHD
jgi:hypothetical protein